MPTLLDIPTLVLAAAALVAGLLLSRLLRKSAPRHTATDDEAVAVAAAIRDYFRKSGVSVSAAATRLEGGMGYTAMVESEPMKRFRLSHIVEKSLVEHVRKSCDLELEKVYWRFPIKGTELPTETKDEYINEGLMNLKDLSQYEVVDSSIEMFTEASQKPTKATDKYD